MQTAIFVIFYVAFAAHRSLVITIVGALYIIISLSQLMLFVDFGRFWLEF